MKAVVLTWIVFFLAWVLSSPRDLYAEEKTLLLDESLIVGMELGTVDSPKKRIAGPALSTALVWDGDPGPTLDIPREILEHLAQSDLSFFKDRESFESLADETRTEKN